MRRCGKSVHGVLTRRRGASSELGPSRLISLNFRTDFIPSSGTPDNYGGEFHLLGIKDTFDGNRLLTISLFPKEMSGSVGCTLFRCSMRTHVRREDPGIRPNSISLLQESYITKFHSFHPRIWIRAPPMSPMSREAYATALLASTLIRFTPPSGIITSFT